MTGDGQARICEGLGVKFSGATRRDHETYGGSGPFQNPNGHTETVFSCCTLSQPSHDAKVSPNARRNGFQRDVALHSPRISFGNPFLNARFLTAIAAVAAEHDIPALRRFVGVLAHVLPRRQIRPRRICQPFLPCLSAVNASPFEVEFNHILPNIFGDPPPRIWTSGFPASGSYLR